MFSIIIEGKEDRDSLVKLDCSKELLERFLQQYEEDRIVFRGKSFSSNQINRIKIFEHDATAEQLRDRANSALRSLASQGISTMMVDTDMKAAHYGNDVTDQYITRPPGYKTKERKLILGDQQEVFVVHGHDRSLKVDVERFLYSVGLKPIVLHRQVNAGNTVIEKFEENANVKYAFILLTPDDLGCADAEYQQDITRENLQHRARQNVIFEWGFFTAKLGRRNVCVLNKGVEVPSDLAGLVYESVSDRGLETIEDRLKNELTQAGLNLKLRMLG
jgi:predicted nucleotide-binding protein